MKNYDSFKKSMSKQKKCPCLNKHRIYFNKEELQVEDARINRTYSSIDLDNVTLNIKSTEGIDQDILNGIKILIYKPKKEFFNTEDELLKIANTLLEYKTSVPI